MKINSFASRHIGPAKSDIKTMLDKVGANDLEDLISATIPAAIRLKDDLNLEEGLTEFDYARHIDEIAAENSVFRSYIGLGYNNCIIPAVIRRNILENPGWYTAYTPYQAEIAQGRLEGLLNFQTVVSDLCGLPIANASLLDEPTAAAEAMIMFFNTRKRDQVKRGANKFFLANDCHPQTIEVMKTRAIPLGIELVIGDPLNSELSEDLFGMLLQFPTTNGDIKDYAHMAESAHEMGCKIAVAADLLSLALLTPPGEWGADVVVGNTQRFGVPLGYGGPHAAFFATKEDYKRNIPGRIIGVSVDRQGKEALRMALQTREQHIRRDKATSNICTAQALLAIMAGMYAVYHGPEGIRHIAEEVHRYTALLAAELEKLGYQRVNQHYFDTLTISASEEEAKTIRDAATAKGINLNYTVVGQVSISLDETVQLGDINDLIEVFSSSVNKTAEPLSADQADRYQTGIHPATMRASEYLTHPVFQSYHSETEMMRYIKRLENKDISLTHSMISLGSCTMKLNAASELYPITHPSFANIHPFVPAEQAKGYRRMIDGLEKDLCEITGFAAVSLQPNSGAQGEYAGLMVIRAYHQSRGDHHRNIALIPSSAHGTNPASAVMAGMKVVVVKCDDQGNIDIPDLKEKATQHSENLASLMVTYPSTHGVFEEGIMEITQIVHDHGGQVYMDGANMNAQVGLTNPATIGADVCHLNLHKTFAIPHGGGGPGMGPIGVAAHLAPFLPGHPVVATGGDHAITPISAAPWGSALILLISYGYIKMLGKEGVTDSTRLAILNANYMKALLEGDYDILYQGKNGRVAHEMIVDCRDFKKVAGVEVEDIAKRLIDFGFHAPTVSFPVAGTMMIEPTESESKAELDRFCQALLTIREEIREIENGSAPQDDNVLKNAPHTANLVMQDNWDKPYTREKAVFPLDWTREAKFWPSVARIDNAYGDRNLICTCPSIESYEAELV